jgi:hypothetical protein
MHWACPRDFLAEPIKSVQLPSFFITIISNPTSKSSASWKLLSDGLREMFPKDSVLRKDARIESKEEVICHSARVREYDHSSAESELDSSRPLSTSIIVRASGFVDDQDSGSYRPAAGQGLDTKVRLVRHGQEYFCEPSRGVGQVKYPSVL